MAHHAESDSDPETTEGLLALDAEPTAAKEPDAEFNPALLILLLVVVALVAIQNLWLRRRAEREQVDERSD